MKALVVLTVVLVGAACGGGTRCYSHVESSIREQNDRPERRSHGAFGGWPPTSTALEPRVCKDPFPSAHKTLGVRLP